jgi:hypothetical protein
VIPVRPPAIIRQERGNSKLSEVPSTSRTIEKKYSMTEIESARTLAKKYNPNHTFVNQKPVKALQVGQQEMKAYAD